jgi:hypothetical protein
MARRNTILILFVGISLGLVAVAAAQGPMGKGMPRYDPATVETVKGTVEELKLMSFGRARLGGGLHLLVNTGQQTVEVHLGPQFYLEENDFNLEPGDTVEVTGSRLTLAGKPALIAREIQAGESRLELRREDGTPLWAGGPGPMRGPGAAVMGEGHHCGHCCCGGRPMCGRWRE